MNDATGLQRQADTQLERLAACPMFEMVALMAGDGATGIGSSEAPGDETSGHENPAPGCLKIGVDRWLVSDPTLELLTTLGSLPDHILTDVTGKWVRFYLSGPGSSRILSSGVDLSAVLATRQLARVTLFDCPAVIRATVYGYVIFVERSYQQCFSSALSHLP